MATYRVVWEKLGRGIGPPVAQTFEDVDHSDELAYQIFMEIRTSKRLASRDIDVVVDLEASEVRAYAGGRRVGYGTLTEVK